jgi:hypothetical protein
MSRVVLAYGLGVATQPVIAVTVALVCRRHLLDHTPRPRR